MNQRPDTGTRILIATIALIVVLSFVLAGHGISDFAYRPTGGVR